jgi:hypothetical protein
MLTRSDMLKTRESYDGPVSCHISGVEYSLMMDCNGRLTDLGITGKGNGASIPYAELAEALKALAPYVGKYPKVTVTYEEDKPQG